jgi:transcription antitermination factor NusG
VDPEKPAQNDPLSSWYVLHCHPNKESFLADELIVRGIEVYYPFLKIKPINPRSRRIRPYFPGYIFILINLLKVGESAFRWLPHAHGLVSFGGNPTSVPRELIIKIQQRLEQSNFDKIPSIYETGESVKILSDTFQGYEAIFDTAIAGTERVRVLLKMLNDRQVILELNKDQIKKK